MGPLVAYKKLLEAFDHEVIMPLKPTQRTFDLGVKNSPEFLCFPYKCVLGTYIESLDRGAEMIVTSGGDGSCRAGFYCEVHRRTLKSLGYDVPFIVFDTPSMHWKEFLAEIKLLKGKHSWYKVYKTLRFCNELIKTLDEIQANIRILRAHEQNRGEFTKVCESIKRLFDARCFSREDIPAVKKEAWDMVHSIPLNDWDKEKTIQIGLVGEIYVAMEGHANQEIEEVLAQMGLEVINSQCVSGWLDHKLHFWPGRKSAVDHIIYKSDPYLKIDLGGHDKENISHMIDYAEKGIDGIIHLMPFACLPELVTQSIIPRIVQDFNIPILSLALDEQRGTANNQTRLEAFIELVKNKKRNCLAQKPA